MSVVADVLSLVMNLQAHGSMFRRGLQLKTWYELWTRDVENVLEQTKEEDVVMLNHLTTQKEHIVRGRRRTFLSMIPGIYHAKRWLQCLHHMYVAEYAIHF